MNTNETTNQPSPARNITVLIWAEIDGDRIEKRISIGDMVSAVGYAGAVEESAKFLAETRIRTGHEIETG